MTHNSANNEQTNNEELINPATSQMESIQALANISEKPLEEQVRIYQKALSDLQEQLHNVE